MAEQTRESLDMFTFDRMSAQFIQLLSTTRILRGTIRDTIDGLISGAGKGGPEGILGVEGIINLSLEAPEGSMYEVFPDDDSVHACSRGYQREPGAWYASTDGSFSYESPLQVKTIRSQIGNDATARLEFIGHEQGGWRQELQFNDIEDFFTQRLSVHSKQFPKA